MPAFSDKRGRSRSRGRTPALNLVCAEFTLSHTDIINMHSTPKLLVAAPGVGKVLEAAYLSLFFDWTADYGNVAGRSLDVDYESVPTNSLIISDDLALILAAGGDIGGLKLSEGMSGISFQIGKAGLDNKPLHLVLSGVGAITGGHAANVLRGNICYVVHNAGW